MFAVCNKRNLLSHWLAYDNLHCVPKDVTTMSHYNSDMRESTLIIFGTNITEKVRIQNVLYIPPHHLTSASALPWETGNSEIASFH